MKRLDQLDRYHNTFRSRIRFLFIRFSKRSDFRYYALNTIIKYNYKAT